MAKTSKQSIDNFENSLEVRERTLLDSLDSPYRIQAFLDSVLYPGGERNRSVLEVLRERQAHCLDGGLFAAACLRRIGFPALILDLLPELGTDDDHVLTLYIIDGCWGAVAKSNYSGRRFREPVYRNLRELVMSYFEDFFNTNAQKTLRGYTRPISLVRFDRFNWMTDARGVDRVEQYLKTLPFIPVISSKQAARLNTLDKRSVDAGQIGLNPEGVFRYKAK
jgi:hypothetical protein